MKITSPHEGTLLNLAEPVLISGIVDSDIGNVRLVVDGQYRLPDANIIDGVWSMHYTFLNGGQRTLTATVGMPPNSASDSTTFLLRASQLNGYRPATESAPLLGGILSQLTRANRVVNNFASGGRNVFQLPGGHLYFDSVLNLDADGSIYAGQYSTGQNLTSLGAIDANAVPYFVLPMGGFESRFGIHLGDIAVVIYKDRLEYAIFADRGPFNKLGEGSIYLHRALGHETIFHGHMRDEAIDSGVITIVFPGSGNHHIQPNGNIRSIGTSEFAHLKSIS